MLVLPYFGAEGLHSLGNCMIGFVGLIGFIGVYRVYRGYRVWGLGFMPFRHGARNLHESVGTTSHRLQPYLHNPRMEIIGIESLKPERTPTLIRR